jgi:hypothetical protein
MSRLGMRKHDGDWHQSEPCPVCIDGLSPIEPYEDWTGESVDCSRCWDKKEI